MGLPVGSETGHADRGYKRAPAIPDSTTLAISTTSRSPSSRPCPIRVATCRSPSTRAGRITDSRKRESPPTVGLHYDGVTFDVDATGAAVSHAYPVRQLSRGPAGADASPDEKTTSWCSRSTSAWATALMVTPAGLCSASPGRSCSTARKLRQDSSTATATASSPTSGISGDGQFDDASGGTPTIGGPSASRWIRR